MSLLMEALRKAEEAKRRMQQEEQANAASANAASANKEPRAGADSASNPPPRSQSGFTLEEREPAVTPQYIRDNFTTPAEPAQVETAYEAPAQTEPEPEPAYVAPAAESNASARNLARRQQRAAAASVFAAKQNPARNRKTLTILVIVMVLMIPAGGGVLWYLQSASAPSIGVNPALMNYDLAARRALEESSQANAAADSPPPPAIADTAPVAAGTPATESVGGLAAAAEAPAPTTAAPAQDEVDGEVVQDATPAIVANSAPAEAATAAPEPVTASTPPPAPAVPVPAPVPGAVATAAPASNGLELPETSSSTTLAISRTRGTTQINPDVAAAYARLQAGDVLVAGQLYQEVLDALPNNRDALLGLALVQMRQGQPAAARELYARLLQLNPRDPLAHTGMLQTVQVSDPTEHESALKQLLTQYPNVAQITLALGNLYASQQRWSEAQAAYYNALLTASRGTSGTVHPDYAFNLAVSLEQLNQPRAALDYYRQAQALAAQIRPGFDPQELESRLEYLSEQQAQP